MFLKLTKIATVASLAISLLGTSNSINAQTLPVPRQAAALNNAEQEQRHRQQQEARERSAAVNAPSVLAPATEHAERPSMPKEAPCFPVQRFVLEVPSDLPVYLQAGGASALPMDPFAFAQLWLDHYQGECLGSQGVGMLIKELSRTILSRGYVTTRVLVPEQDLTSGTLKLALIPGVIGEIRFSKPDLWGTWSAAFPTSAGQLLNLRDLEQGLEQMKRVASQDVDMQIMPTPVPGLSDVVITVKRGKPWTLVASVDNSGSRSTGKWQGNLSLGIDNPLGLSDIFNVGFSQDVMVEDKEFGTPGLEHFLLDSLGILDRHPLSFQQQLLPADRGRQSDVHIQRQVGEYRSQTASGIAPQPKRRARHAHAFDASIRPELHRGLRNLAPAAE